jgi:hypothetical protein
MKISYCVSFEGLAVSPEAIAKAITRELLTLQKVS